MLNQKGLASILPLLVSLILVGLIAGGYFYYQSLPHELASDPDAMQDIKETTQLDEGFKEGEGVVDFSYPETDTKITYSGDWKAAEINEDENYHHSVNIFYPATWQFGCCGDTGGGSGHSLDPNPSDPNSDVKPLITIFDHALQDCPDENDCYMDKLQKVTPAKLMSSMVKNIDKYGTGTQGLTSLKKAAPVKINNFIGDATVYIGLSSTIQPVELYLLQSKEGVVSVMFQQPQVFDPAFKMDFLNRLTPNE